VEQLTAPPSVDVLGSPSCPVCFSPSDFPNGRCEVCGARPYGGDPDLDDDEDDWGDEEEWGDEDEAPPGEADQSPVDLGTRSAAQRTTCPVCASVDSFRAGRCGVCGAAKPPAAFMDPDLSAAHKLDAERKKALDPAAPSGPSEVVCSACGSLFPTPAGSQGPHLDAPASPSPLMADPDPRSALQGVDTIDLSAYEPGTTCPVCGRGTLVPVDDVDPEDEDDDRPGERLGARRKRPPRCRWCRKPAAVMVLGAESAAAVPTCNSHMARSRVYVEDTHGDQVLGVRPLPRPKG